ncbi:MAG TPA: lipid-A-disaccharide synthase N-terminal domain-containing protein [Candidatus Eisenbacteria bacterium]|nr:lipid-A-disaccharide synthase N-terminal domain-containing protein [Candidatus Eisenbacteria bacterium]
MWTKWFSSPTEWYVLGFLGQLFFSSRFIVQWLASEIAKKPVLPRNFWYLSLGGGVALLVYAIHRRDPVFAIGQAAGLVVYARNLMLDRGAAAAAPAAGA